MEVQAAIHNAERRQRARELVQKQDVFFRLSDEGNASLPEQETDYDATLLYKEELEFYFRYNIDYFPYFEEEYKHRNPFKWNYYIDIHDAIVEDKFKRDQDIRAYINAYRYTVHENQKHNILRKRIAQLIASLGCLIVGFLSAIGSNIDSYQRAVGGWEFGIFAAVMFALSFIGLQAFLRINVGRLHDTFQANAKDLSARIQHRLNDLSQNYTIFLMRTQEEEFNTAHVENPEWTQRVKWWVMLAMWNSKRIEYIEKYLQSEMQRMRIFTLWSGLVGRMITYTLWAILAGTAIGISLLSAPLFSLTSVYTLLGVSLSFFFGWYSLKEQFSISIDKLRRWVGNSDWKRFSDIGLHQDVGELIRRDKDRLRQEKLRGGFGGGRPGL